MCRCVCETISPLSGEVRDALVAEYVDDTCCSSRPSVRSGLGDSVTPPFLSPLDIGCPCMPLATPIIYGLPRVAPFTGFSLPRVSRILFLFLLQRCPLSLSFCLRLLLILEVCVSLSFCRLSVGLSISLATCLRRSVCLCPCYCLFDSVIVDVRLSVSRR